MFITVINDCSDANAAGRIATRIRALFEVTPVFMPVASTLDSAAQLEASGNLVDVLDAASGREGVVLLNVAPRNGDERTWGNGTPFGTFTVGKVRVHTTVSGLSLLLPARLGLCSSIDVYDLPRTVERMYETGAISEAERSSIPHSQFRSFNFLPYVAHYVLHGGEAVYETKELSAPSIGPRIWAIDSFGNLKTTLTLDDLGGATKLLTELGELPYVPSLKDVPEGVLALTLGSSGFGTTRFLEIAMQGGSAAEALHVSLGARLFAD